MSKPFAPCLVSLLYHLQNVQEILFWHTYLSLIKFQAICTMSFFFALSPATFSKVTTIRWLEQMLHIHLTLIEAIEDFSIKVFFISQKLIKCKTLDPLIIIKFILQSLNLRRLGSFETKSLDLRNIFCRSYLVNTR